MSEPTPCCRYCGCTSAKSLAKCPGTDFYLCNGAGDTPDSHLVHYMKLAHVESIELPEWNDFARTRFECFFCSSTNVLDLNLVPVDETWYFACARCLKQRKYKGRVQLEVDKKTPLVADGCFREEILEKPVVGKDGHRRVPLGEIRAIDRELGIVNDDEVSEGNMRLKFDSVDEYCAMMNRFVEWEAESTREFYRGMECVVKPSRHSGCDTKCYFSCPSYKLFDVLRVGTRVRLVIKGEPRDGVVLKKVAGGTVEVGLRGESIAKEVDDARLSLVVDEERFEMQKRAIKSFHDGGTSKFLRRLVLGQVNPETFEKRNNLRSDVFTYKTDDSPKELDDIQMSVIEKACRRRFTVIQGTPGSGKTTVTIPIVYSLVRSGIKRVLVLVDSMETGYRVAKALHNARVRVCWIKSYVDPDAERHPFTLRELMKRDREYDPNMKINNETDRKRFHDLEQKIISQSDVVVISRNGTEYAKLDSSVFFMAVVVYGSQSCLDPDLLVLLSHGAKQLILIGDIGFPGAHVISSDCRRARYDMTMMQRMFLLGVQSSILRVQYRMHPLLGDLVSRVFYGEHMINGISESEMIPLPDGLPIGKPLLFWHVPGSEESEKESLFNNEEAENIARLFWDMKRKDSIGIMTPSTAQDGHIFRNIKKLQATNPEPHFEIGTIERFQGKAKDIVVMSCVRSSPPEQDWAWADPKRLCLALSRANYCVIVVGHARALLAAGRWRQLVEYCSNEEALVIRDPKGAFAQVYLTEIDDATS